MSLNGVSITVRHLVQYQAIVPNSIQVIAHALGCSRLHAATVYVTSVYRAARCQAAFDDLCARGQLLEAAGEVHMQGAEGLADMRSTERPLLIATMHMGQFQLGLLRLLQQMRPDKRIAMFKLNEANDNERVLLAAVAQLGYKMDVYRTFEDGGRLAYMALRRGDVVVMTLDLEVVVRSRSLVTMLGHTCRMQNGPAALAVMTGACIVPIVAQPGAGGTHVLRVVPVIDSKASRWGASTAERVAAITQALATLMQGWVESRPTDVQLWGAIAQTLGNSAASA